MPRRRASQPDPEFFLHRSLGRYVVADALTAAGLVVHTLASVYGEEQGQHVPDTAWLERAGAHGWVVLMKDDAIRRRPHETAALREAGVRAFCITNGNLTGETMAALFLRHRHRIAREAQRPGPSVFGVYATGLRRLLD